MNPSSDRSLLSRNNASTTRILGSYSYIRNDQSASYLKLNKTGNDPENENEIEESPVQISEGMSEADPNDFGYYTIVKKNVNIKHEPELIEANKSGLFNTVNKAIKKVNKFEITRMNLLRKINEVDFDERTGEQRKNVRNQKEMIYTFAKEENDYKNFDLPNFFDIQNNLPAVTMGSKNGKKNKIQPVEEDVLQTENSYILKKQYHEISNNNMDHAQQLNYEYAKRKECYEINLIFSLLKKLETSLEPGSKLVIENPSRFHELKKESAQLIEKFRTTTNKEKYFLTSVKIEATKILIDFMKRVEKEVDDTPTKSNELEIKHLKNHIKWKKKISELVNIWELFSSNGIEMKFPVKYLVLKKYLTARALKRQNETERGKKDEDGGNLLSGIWKSLFSSSKSKFIPRGVFLPNQLINFLIEVLVSIFLMYSLFIIPVVEFLGYQSDTLLSIEKFVDVFFFIEIITNFRKAFKDKTNEFVYDIKKIMISYLTSRFIIDIISTIPWYFFLIKSPDTFGTVKKTVRVFKIVQINKFGPVNAKLESMKGANYYRLFKLFFIFGLFAHWLGCIMFAGINQSLDFEGLVDSCFIDNLDRSKDNVTFPCRYIFSVYNSAYIIPGQYTSAMGGNSELAPSGEYGIYVFQYMIGQILSAYIFGGMAAIIQNLNQGQNFFSNKMDMLNDHMKFYDVHNTTMLDVKIYYDYMWQRHKDVIYGKHHFDLLSKSLREKFERLNLPGNEILLAKFYNLNPGNSKLIGNILMNLSKLILFPYEILFEVGSVTKGIYILLNGDIQLGNDLIKNSNQSEFIISYGDIISKLREKEKNKDTKTNYFDERDSVIFPLLSALIKTGRNWQRCYSANFGDLLFLPIAAFDQLVFNFPIEMHILKHKTMEFVTSKKIFENPEIFKLISKHSSRSVGKYFLKEYDKITVWIPIPIPISQRKIAGNYIDTFIKKVRNQWREILLIGDLNVCLNSYSAINLIKSSGKKENLETKAVYSDPIDNIKAITKDIDKLTEMFLHEFEA